MDIYILGLFFSFLVQTVVNSKYFLCFFLQILLHNDLMKFVLVLVMTLFFLTTFCLAHLFIKANVINVNIFRLTHLFPPVRYLYNNTLYCSWWIIHLWNYSTTTFHSSLFLHKRNFIFSSCASDLVPEPQSKMEKDWNVEGAGADHQATLAFNKSTAPLLWGNPTFLLKRMRGTTAGRS